MAYERLSKPPSPPIQEPIAALVRATSAAKRATARMYQAWQTRAPDADVRDGLAQLASEETAHVQALDHLLGVLNLSSVFAQQRPFQAKSEERGSATGWPSALMAAFALDQAASACLAALAHARSVELVEVARSILADERSHQDFVVATFSKLADENPPLGQRLAVEMIVARDWVREIFPRHDELVALVNDGHLPPEAPRAHDSFLASLGDRIQEALGVIGY